MSNNPAERIEKGDDDHSQLKVLESTLFKILTEREHTTGPNPIRIKRILNAVRKTISLGGEIISLSTLAEEFKDLKDPRRAAASAITYLNEQLEKSGAKIRLKGDLLYKATRRPGNEVSLDLNHDLGSIQDKLIAIKNWTEGDLPQASNKILEIINEIYLDINNLREKLKEKK